MSSHPIGRRKVLKRSSTLMGTSLIFPFFHSCSEEGKGATENATDAKLEETNPMKIHYLEIVTPDAENAVLLYSQVHGLEFGEQNPTLGGARTAELGDGGMVGIRGLLRDNEKPVVRPYFLVDDIDKAVSQAEENGAEIAMTPTEIPGAGRFAILIQGGIESGLWEV